MPALAWHSGMSVGNRELDIQHRHFLGLISNLLAAEAHAYPQAMIADLVEAIVRYGEAHFASEEQLMRIHRFAGMAEHLRQHDELRQRLAAWMATWQAGTGSIPALARLLLEWFNDHTQRCDRELADHLNACIGHAEPELVGVPR